MAILNGSWYFNENIILPETGTFSISFGEAGGSCFTDGYGTEYPIMYIYSAGGQYGLVYGWGQTFPLGEDGSLTWVDNKYREINFLADIEVDETTYTWFMANAISGTQKLYTEAYIRSIAEAIRGKAGTEETYKVSQMADGVNAVYEVGYEAGYEAGKKDESTVFWNGVTDLGERTNYVYAFRYWGAEYLQPSVKIEPKSADSGNQTFNNCKKLKKLESKHFDFSQKQRGTGTQSAFYYTFNQCALLEEVEDIGMQADYAYTNTFNGCTALHTIAKIRCDEATLFSSAFAYCRALRNISFDGVIGQNISFADCTKLSADSIKSIITHLSDTAAGKTLTLSRTAVENAIPNGGFGEDTVYMTTNGAFSDYLYSNPINLTAGQRIKIEAEWEEGHDFDSNDAPDWWFDSTGDGQTVDEATQTPGYPLPRYYTATSDEQVVFGWYFDSNVAVSNIPIKIRAVLVDEDGNELTGENLHSFVTNTVSDSQSTLTITHDSWEKLVASKPNWTISLV